MTYQDAMNYIDETSRLGSVLGLQNMEQLLLRLENPQEKLKFIHIAGTNGKGSTLAMISTVLQCEGYRVGRYISPTLFEYRERIQVNGTEISKVKFAQLLEKIKNEIDKMIQVGFQHPTVFEIETALAFLYFKEKKCDIVVLETGLGGLLDATNIITTTIAAVLTTISMDHMDYLGNTLEEIARHKAGIIKQGCSVISGNQLEEVEHVVKEACEKYSCELTITKETNAVVVNSGIKKQIFHYGPLKKIEISLGGAYQIKNAVLAIEVINALNRRKFHVSEEALRRGLKEAKWMGRFSVVGENPLFIVDGAHNEDAAKQLAESIQFHFTNKKIIYIMGVLKDKEYRKIIEMTQAYAEHIITVTTPNNKRAMNAYELAQVIKEYNQMVTCADSLEEAVEISYLLADKESVIIAFGSLSYLGELITLIKNRDKNRRDFHGRSE